METKKIIGQVTTDEKNEILRLFERRNGLRELSKILTADNSELYEKLVKDLGETGVKFQSWWDRMAENISGKAKRMVTGRLISILVKSVW